jgi:hypothetical protein
MRLTKDQFKEWRESEATEVFLKYAADLANREGELVKESFRCGGLHTVDMNYISQQSGKAIAWEELSDINFEEIEQYYEDERQPDQNTET